MGSFRKRDFKTDKLDIMKAIILFTLFVVGQMICPFAHAQEVLNVDPLTGALQGSIPLMTVRSKTLSYPISASYHTNGQKPYEGTGNMGIGWNMDDSPSIVREIRDLPDELLDSVMTGATLDYRKVGWLNGGDSLVSRVLDGNPASADFYQRLDALGGFASDQDIYDTEPDIFHVSVPGHLSFSFILSSEGAPTVLSNDTHYQISFGKDENGYISDFKITSPGNITYHFDFYSISTAGFEAYNNSSGFYWKRYFNELDKTVYFASNWFLTEITTPTGDHLKFEYKEQTLVQTLLQNLQLTPSRYRDTIRVYSYNSAEADYTPAYRITRNRLTPFDPELVAISSNLQELRIGRGSNVIPEGGYELESTLIDDISLLDKRTNEQITRYQFSYVPIKNNEATDDSYSHIYLDAIYQRTEVRGRLLYSFDYYGIDFENGKSLFTQRHSKDLDEFGYYAKRDNSDVLRKVYCYPDLSASHQYRTFPILDYAGKEVVLDGFSPKVPDQRIIQTGSMKSVKTHLGGIQSIVYELNEYYDSLNQADQYGGGIRVKSMILQDGIEHDRDLIKNYSYTEIDGNSSGRLIYRPIYAAQIPIFYDDNDASTSFYKDLEDAGMSEEDLWKRMTIRSVHDLYKDEDPGYNVAYSVFKESVTGLGDRVYQFNIPFTFSDKSAIPYTNQGLNETINQSNATGFVKLTDNSPYYEWMLDRPNSKDYQWNGLISSMTTLSASGDSVAASFYEYSRVGAESAFKGLRIDQYPQKYTNSSQIEMAGTFFWRPYTIKIRKEDVLTQKVDKVYDGNGSSIATTMDYTYTNSLRIREEKTTLNDGTSYTTTYKYVDDYSATAQATDQMAKALYFMNEGWNYDQTPVEVKTSYYNGTEQKVTNASLTLWKYDDTSAIKPRATQTYRFISKNGATDFQNSEVTSDVFSKEGDYELISEVKARNIENQAIASLSRGLFRSGIHYGAYGEVKLTINGAFAEEVLFSDFEGDSEFSLDTYNAANITGGRVIGSGLTVNELETISGTCKKGVDDKYLISFWIKSSQSGSIQLSIADDLSGNVSSNVAIVDTQGEWKYVESTLSVGSLAGTELTISITSPMLSVVLDDFAAYPLEASINHTLFGKGYIKLAETNSQGQTTTYTYDDLYRPILIKNTDNEIVSYQEYGTTDRFNPIKTLSIWPEREIVHNVSTTFTSSLDISGASYRWKVLTEAEYTANPDNFSSPQVTSANAFTTTLAAGVYVVKLKVDNGVFERESSKIITVIYPLVLDICSNRPSAIDLCNQDEVKSGCGPQQPNPGELTVTANVTNGSGNYIYYWLRRRPGAGTSLDTLSIDSTVNYYTTPGYFDRTFRVDVLDKDGPPGSTVSGEVRFTTYQSDPNCNPNIN